MSKRLTSWLRELFRPTRPAPRRRRCRPSLDVLEDRLAPAVFTVNTLVDENDGVGLGNVSLRDAVAAANANPGDDTITFAAGLTGPIHLLHGQLTLSDASGTTTITGPGPAALTVSGDGAIGIFQVGSGVTTSVSGLTIADGGGTNGGGIFNQGTLMVTDCTLSGNRGFDGGGIYNRGTVTVTDCTLSGNSAQDTGGGIYNLGTLTVAGSTLSGNSAQAGGGGGIDNFSTLTLTASTLSGNTAPEGGAIVNEGTLTVTDCTLAGNAASGLGGGIFNHSTIVIVNSTLSGNSATGSGGGLYCTSSTSDVRITNSTLTGNRADSDGNGQGTGGGYFFGGLGGSLTLHNALVAGNLRGTGTTPDDITINAPDHTVTGSHSLIGDAGSSGGLQDGFDGNLVGSHGSGALDITTVLAPLADNGGPTPTCALVADSLALDAGDPTLVPAGVTRDQRGAPFARAFGPAVDIGAFEAQSLNLVVDTTADVDNGNYAVGDLSLREAVKLANANPGPDTITFNLLGSSTITLGGTLVLSDTSGATTITGPGASALTVSGNHATTVFQLNGSGVTAALSGLTIANGSGSGAVVNVGTLAVTDCTFTGNSGSEGGGIFNNGLLTVTGCTFSDNSTQASQVGTGGAIASITSSLLTVTDSVFIGNFADTGGGGIFSVSPLTVTGCTFSGNSAGGFDGGFGGGAIDCRGPLTVTGSTFTDNTSESTGGGIECGGPTTVTGSAFAGNSAALGGGAIKNSGVLTVTDCTFSDNSVVILGGGIGGGGIASFGQLTVTDCTFTGNTVADPYGGGGGISSLAPSSRVTRCTFTDNSSADFGGGLYSTADLTVTDCAFTGNEADAEGGGISSFGPLAVTGSTFSGNTAPVSGGGISTYQLTAFDCTFSGNTASFGGGLYGAPLLGVPLTVVDCTFSGNSASSGGGILINGGVMNLTGTILANSPAGGDLVVEDGAAFGSEDLIEDGTGVGMQFVNSRSCDPLLAPLGNYGGLTQTFALLPGSPAINAGSPAEVTPDQRGFGTVGPRDIGAFESQGLTLAVASGGGQSAPVTTAFAAPLVVRVTATNPMEPVAGGRVTFTAPGSGASATLSSATAVIAADGTARVTATANDTGGAYSVTASANGAAGTPAFALTNTGSATASLSGVVFADVNGNSLYDANEPGIDGATIQLLDATGTTLLTSTTTTGGGFYLFDGLAPGTYRIHEVQPSGVTDGADLLGSLGGSVVANDTFQVALGGVDGSDYDFAERGLAPTHGDSAGIGFWQNKHGQALITAGGTALADWLTATFHNVFGNSLAGASGAAVAAFYKDQLFNQAGQHPAGPAKVDAQFMATALAVYFTNDHLAGTVAAAYGLNVTDTGLGDKVVNVGSSGAAFGVANGTARTVLELLQATNALTDVNNHVAGFDYLYDANGDGVIDATEAALRTQANAIYSSINNAGGI
jgi:predicted outer membrane repeat protein